MASENQNQSGGSSAKQKATIAIIAIVFLVLVWQVYQMFVNSSSSELQPSTVQPIIIKKELKLAQDSTNNNMNSQTEDISVRESTIQNSNRFREMQRQTEEQYLGKLSELEELKLQQQIAETNQAISAAKLATVTAEKDISNLLTAPPRSANPTLSEYSEQIQQQAKTIEAKKEEKPKIPDVNYNVVLVSKTLNRWEAILSYNNKYYNVRVGDKLPPDGSIVQSINDRRVRLKKDGKNRSISILTLVEMGSDGNTTQQSAVLPQSSPPQLQLQ